MLWSRAAVALALLVPLAGPPAAATVAPLVCTAPTHSITQPGYLVDDPD